MKPNMIDLENQGIEDSHCIKMFTFLARKNIIVKINLRRN